MTLALKGYGPELFGFLVTMHGGEDDASDAFAETLRGAVARGLPAFAWECSFRTWAHAVARNQMRMRVRGAVRRRRRGARVGDSALAEVAAAVRTETLAFLRTATRSRFQSLRDALPEDDRMLLVLRIDRQLAWNDLARVLAERDGDAPLADAAVTKEAARLRKQLFSS